MKDNYVMTYITQCKILNLELDCLNDSDTPSEQIRLPLAFLRLTIICGTERNETEQCLGCKVGVNMKIRLSVVSSLLASLYSSCLRFPCVILFILRQRASTILYYFYIRKILVIKIYFERRFNMFRFVALYC